MTVLERTAASMPGPSPFVPRIARILSARDETGDVRTLRLALQDGPSPAWSAGQFGAFTVFGFGEAVFTIANAPTRGPEIECTTRAVGKVTNALRGLSPGQCVGFRGPFGNRFPVDGWTGRSVAFVGGGIGMAALRSPLQWVLDHRDAYGDVLVLNGARTSGDLCYAGEAAEWEAAGARVVRTVDPGGAAEGWDGEVGLLPDVFASLGLPADGRVVVVCGPPVMLHFMFLALAKAGYAKEQVVTTLENRMKCGMGLCGRCNAGRHYVCTDGPVFTWAELSGIPKDY
jgi:sulfhydrogenase subunit gamma (sulfur reductase)